MMNRPKFLIRLIFTAGPIQAWNWCTSWKQGAAPVPWIPIPAIKYLETLSLDGSHVFEWGSGASTKYWIRRGASCVSIEHDPKWYDVTSRDCEGADVTLLQSDPMALSFADPADPKGFTSADPNFLHHSFERYVQAIDKYPDKYFDVIFIDGRARPSCLSRAIPKVKNSGLIVLDNADREYYLAKTRTYLKDFHVTLISGPVVHTTQFSTTAFLTSVPSPRAAEHTSSRVLEE